MAPVYMKACVLAVAGGRHRKPVYRVTRKHDEHRWYWRLVIPQMVALAVLVGAMAKTLAGDSLLYEVDLGSLYWACLFAITLGSFMPPSWYRVELRDRLAALVARRAATSRGEPGPRPRRARGAAHLRQRGGSRAGGPDASIPCSARSARPGGCWWWTGAASRSPPSWPGAWTAS